MRAIDADALLKRVQQEEIQAQVHGREFSTCFLSPGGTPSTEWWYVEDLIENAPTIEPEIIRCRDCKHYYFADNRIPQEQRYVCDLDGDRWKPDDYCSFAERMKGEQE